MADISKEQAEQLALDAGFTPLGNQAWDGFDANFERLVQAAFKLGRNAGLEEAAQKCRAAAASIWDYHDDGRKEIGANVCNNLAAAIESLKDNTP